MLKCALEALPRLFAEIAGFEKLYLPIDRKDGNAFFDEWHDGVTCSDALNTAKSPKDFFFPQAEDLIRFQTAGKSIEVIDIREECEDFVLFGVRACDAKSLDVLDSVFLNEPTDSFYAMKRKHATIVSLACTKPSETCFCTTFGIDPAKPHGDVSAWKTEDSLYLSPNTEKGQRLLDRISHLFEECSDEAVTSQQKRIAMILQRLPLKALSTDAFGAGKTQALFHHPAWDSLSESCLGCGACTFVCPTCQCYDIKDFNTGNGIIRYRCWDSCMYSEFTKMAHGNNRLTQKERFRQRFMHKLVYSPENNDGLFGCVGCGRCLTKCPISMNIVKVMKRIGGCNDEAGQ